MVDGGRLWRRISELGEIGRQETGGVTRLSFTDEERAAKDLVASYMEEAGLSVREDAAGNLLGRREGRDPDAPSVIVGSHVDSVYNGGDFDGPLGVLAGIEVAHALERGSVECERPVEVVAFTDEEGARFSFGMIGSRALAGRLTAEDLNHEDENGVSIAEAMRGYGLDPERVGEAARSEGIGRGLRRAAHRAGPNTRAGGFGGRGRHRHSRPRVAQARPHRRDRARGHDADGSAARPSGRGCGDHGYRRDRGRGYRHERGDGRPTRPATGRYQHNPRPGRVLARPARHRRWGQRQCRGPHPGTG